jgi:hypothetical protein
VNETLTDVTENLPAPAGATGSKARERAASVNVLICMFGSVPEPPTLNAILVLSEWFKSVTFLRSNLTVPRESYPVVPILKEIGAACDVQEARRRSVGI